MRRRVSFFDSFVPRSCMIFLGVLVIAGAGAGQARQQTDPPAGQPANQQPAPEPNQPAQPSKDQPVRRVAPAPVRSRRTLGTQRLKTIQLPEPVTSSAVSLEQAIIEQANMQLPGNQRVEFAKIGQLAWAAQGVRMSPAVSTPAPTRMPGERFPIVVYFVLPDGVYLYNPTGHTLQQTGEGDGRQTIANALLNQPAAVTGGFQVILAGSFRDFAARYGARARTVMQLQAGRMSQNIQLQAAALGLAFIGIDTVESSSVRRVTRIARNLDPLYAAIVGYPASEAARQTATEQVVNGTKRALLVVPPQGFQDQELLETRRVLELAGVQVTLASTRMGPILGMLGGTAQADILLNQANVDNYDAIVFIGGVGAIDYINNPIAQNLVRRAVARGKVLAAIGTAPSILAGAGALSGVRATAYLSEQGRLVLGGANYTGNPVEKDGLIVTAVGPLAATTFAQAIVDGLAEQG